MKRTEQALCRLLGHDTLGEEDQLFAWAPAPWELQNASWNVARRLLELADETHDPDDKHRWWGWVPKLAKEKNVKLELDVWCKALDVLWRNQGLKESERIEGVRALVSQMPETFDWAPVASVIGNIPSEMRADGMLQACVSAGLSKEQPVSDYWDGQKISVPVASTVKELFSVNWIAKKEKSNAWSDEEWRRLWWRVKWSGDKKQGSVRVNELNSLAEQNQALLELAAQRGHQKSDLFHAIDTSWSVQVALERSLQWTHASGVSQLKVWREKDESGAPLWMRALARHPELVLSERNKRRKGFWDAVDWQEKDGLGRDALSYLAAGLLLSLNATGRSELWERACQEAGLKPEHSEKFKLHQAFLTQIKSNPEKWLGSFIVGEDNEIHSVAEMLSFLTGGGSSWGEKTSNRTHPYEKEWLKWLPHAIEIGVKWSNEPASHPLPEEIVLRRGDEIGKFNWKRAEVGASLEKLAQAALVSKNWEWLNPDLETAIKDLEKAVEKNPALVDWASGQLLWKLMYNDRECEQEKEDRRRVLKRWAASTLKCSAWKVMLDLRLRTALDALQIEGIERIQSVVNWWSKEVNPLWERRLLQRRVGLEDANVATKTAAL